MLHARTRSRRVKPRVLAKFYSQFADLLRVRRSAASRLATAPQAVVEPGACGNPRRHHQTGRRRRLHRRRDEGPRTNVRRTGRQHGPRGPGGRLSRRRLQADRGLHRTAGRTSRQGRRRPRLSRDAAADRIQRRRASHRLLRAEIRTHLRPTPRTRRAPGRHRIPSGLQRGAAVLRIVDSRRALQWRFISPECN